MRHGNLLAKVDHIRDLEAEGDFHMTATPRLFRMLDDADAAIGPVLNELKRRAAHDYFVAERLRERGHKQGTT